MVDDMIRSKGPRESLAERYFQQINGYVYDIAYG
jgi:hypothetical protein